MPGGAAGMRPSRDFEEGRRKTMSDMTPTLESAATATATGWLDAFAEALTAGDVEAVQGLFCDDCYWRDLLAFTWNIATMEGKPSFAEMLKARLAPTAPTGWRLTGAATEREGVVEAWLAFETAVATGVGHLRLKDGRAWTLFTAVEELKGHEEPKGPLRPLGTSHEASRSREVWQERRAREAAALGRDVQPYVAIIGGGQGGIMLGARLKQFGVPALILEKNARPGDNWRNRYRSLVLHDPVWYDHLPYIPFPETWPVFTPKDKLGDWLEMYTRVMELDYWGSTTAERAVFDEETETWSVEVERAGERLTLRPKHLVFATGAYGPPRRIALAGAEDFAGRILHSSEYRDGRDFAGQRVVVIGSATSGHDVSLDLWEGGAEVTMVQRHPTTVVKSETLMDLGFEIYSEKALAAGITCDVADRIVAATPIALFAEQQKTVWARIREQDAEFYAALARAGFALDWGEDESGLMMKAYRTGSGYYIDVGCSELIIDGRIGLKSGVEIDRLTRGGVRFADGSEVAADAIVECTGYQSMHETVASLVSRDVADAVGPCWGLGSGVRNDPGPWQGELRNMWKPTAHPALWFQGGNLGLQRYYSRLLALQLKARMAGIATPVHRPAMPERSFAA
jgi:putative flavoprotein involved in K+ transport